MRKPRKRCGAHQQPSLRRTNDGEEFRRACDGPPQCITLWGPNNALLMFRLRKHGKDEGGKRTTINYASSRATDRPAALPELRSSS